MKGTLAAAVVALATLAAPSSLAHHSFAQFDQTREIELKGTVTDWQFVSPHTWLYLLVPGTGKAPDKWSIEGLDPVLLRKVGFAKDTFAPGDKVTVYAFPLRNGAKGAALNAALLPDGRLVGKRMEAPK
jgi:hypothetical protein